MSLVFKLLSYFDAHQIGWIAWTWVVQGSPDISGGLIFRVLYFIIAPYR